MTFLSPWWDTQIWIAKIQPEFEKLQKEVNNDVLDAVSSSLIFFGIQSNFFDYNLKPAVLNNATKVLILIGKELRRNPKDFSNKFEKIFPDLVR